MRLTYDNCIMITSLMTKLKKSIEIRFVIITQNTTPQIYINVFSTSYEWGRIGLYRIVLLTSGRPTTTSLVHVLYGIRLYNTVDCI